MSANKPGPDVDATCQGTHRSHGASPATDKHSQQQQALDEQAAWGALISAQAQYPSLSLLGGRACLWQDPLSGSLGLVPGSARSQQLCHLEVQKQGPSGGQPLVVLSAVCSHALQLDGRTLVAGDRVPLRSGSELTILTSFSAPPSLQDARGGALFLFMPANLSAYNEGLAGRTGADGPAPAAPLGAAAVSAKPQPKGSSARANGSGVGIVGVDSSGGIAGRVQAQAACRATLLESLLQRASLGAGRGGVASEDAWFSAAPSSQPFRRAPGTIAQPQQPQQHPHDPHLEQQLKQGYGQGPNAHFWPLLSRMNSVSPQLLRFLWRGGNSGLPARWQGVGRAAESASSPWKQQGQQGGGGVADVAPDMYPAMQRLKRLRAAITAAGLASGAAPDAFAASPSELPLPRSGQQTAGPAGTATVAGQDPAAMGSVSDGAVWADLARLGHSITAAAAAAAAATASIESEALDGWEGGRNTAAAPPVAQPQRQQPQRPHRQQHKQPQHRAQHQHQRSPTPAEAAADAAAADDDVQMAELLQEILGAGEDWVPPDEQDAAAVAAGTTHPGVSGLGAPSRSGCRAALQGDAALAVRGDGVRGRDGGSGSGPRGDRSRRAAKRLAEFLLMELLVKGDVAEPAADAVLAGLVNDGSASGVQNVMLRKPPQTGPAARRLPGGASVSAPVSPEAARLAEGLRRAQARSSAGGLQALSPGMPRDSAVGGVVGPGTGPRAGGAGSNVHRLAAAGQAGGGRVLPRHMPPGQGQGMDAEDAAAGQADRVMSGKRAEAQVNLHALLREALQGLLAAEAPRGNTLGVSTAPATTTDGAGGGLVTMEDKAGCAGTEVSPPTTTEPRTELHEQPQMQGAAAHMHTADGATLACSPKSPPAATAAAGEAADPGSARPDRPTTGTDSAALDPSSRGELLAASSVAAAAVAAASGSVTDMDVDAKAGPSGSAGGPLAGDAAASQRRDLTAADSDALVDDILTGLLCGALEEAGVAAAAAVAVAGSAGGDRSVALADDGDGHGGGRGNSIGDADRGGGDGGNGMDVGKCGTAAAIETAAPVAVGKGVGGPATQAEVAAVAPAAVDREEEEGLDTAMEAPAMRVVAPADEERTEDVRDPPEAPEEAVVEPAEACKQAQAAKAGEPSSAAAATAPKASPQQHQQPLSDPMKKRVAAFKAELAASAFTRPEALTVTFDNLPYYLGTGTKERLMATAMLHLRYSRFANFTADLASMSPRVLLSGPFGSDLYQQAIVSCVAAACGANLLVFDRVALGLDGDGLSGPGAAGSGAAPGLGEAADDGREGDLDLDDDDDSLDMGLDPSRFASRWQPSGLKRRRLLGFFGGPPGSAPDKGLGGSGGGGPAGGSGSGGAAGAAGEKNPAGAAGTSGRGAGAGGEKGLTSGPRLLRKGDRVRFWGPGGSGLAGMTGLPGPLGGALLGPGPMTYLVTAMGQRAASRLGGDGGAAPGSSGGGPSGGTSSYGGGGARGPGPGAAGRVVLAFEDNPKKVGVRFETPIPGGLDLGGACEEGHGFFCSTSELLLEGSRQDEEAEAAAVVALFELAAETAALGPVVVHIRDAERVVVGNAERFSRVRRALEALPPGVVVVASHAPRSAGAGRGGSGGVLSGWPGGGAGPRLHGVMEPMLILDPMFGRLADKVRGLTGSDDPRDSRSVRALLKAFPNRVTLHPPHGEPAASEWRATLERDVATLRERANRRSLAALMSRCGVECGDMEAVVIRDQALSTEAVERIVGWAVAAAVQRAAAAAVATSGKAALGRAATPPVETASNAGLSAGMPAAGSAAPAAAAASPGGAPYSATPLGTSTDEDVLLRSGQLQVTAADVAAAVATLKAVAAERVPPSKQGLQDVQVEGEFEKRLLAEVVPPEELGVSFDSIGALENVKETLREVVMLPLQRPELFARGTLTKPTKGVLLFGPPGTGKTMLAKAVASECGANFLYVSLSSVTSKWFGEAEKYIKAVFTLAHKIAPSVIFVDEVDSLLGKRTGSSSEHEASRKMKNEFMAHWDGLKTRQKDRVMVLAATNRPMDLDEAVIRRMPRRIMVDLPDASNRVKILKVLLKDENLDPAFSMEELAQATEGYSGSDLKNMCVAAAYRPIRELIAAEKAAAAAVRNAAAAKDGIEGAETGSERAGGAEQDANTTASVAVAADPTAGREPSSSARGVTPEMAAPVPAQSGGASAATTQAPPLRALKMNDFKSAMQQVGPSVSSDQGSLITELRRWNEVYGEGGKRKADTLTYFL